MKYLETWDELATEMSLWSGELVDMWLRNYVFHNRTAPFITIGRADSSPYRLPAHLFEKGDSRFKGIFNAMLVKIYEDFSEGRIPEGVNKGGVGETLLTIIANTEVTAPLLEKLTGDAVSGKYKGMLLGSYPDSVDLHTGLLKTLFVPAYAVQLDKTAHKRLVQIVERDIHDPKYSLECFRTACILWGEDALRYKLILEAQIPGARRDVKGTIERGMALTTYPSLEARIKAEEEHPFGSLPPYAPKA